MSWGGSSKKYIIWDVQRLFGVDKFEDMLLLEDGYTALLDVLLQFVNVDDEGSYALFKIFSFYGWFKLDDFQFLRFLIFMDGL